MSAAFIGWELVLDGNVNKLYRKIYPDGTSLEAWVRYDGLTGYRRYSAKRILQWVKVVQP